MRTAICLSSTPCTERVFYRCAYYSFPLTLFLLAQGCFRCKSCLLNGFHTYWRFVVCREKEGSHLLHRIPRVLTSKHANRQRLLLKWFATESVSCTRNNKALRTSSIEETSVTPGCCRACYFVCGSLQQHG